MSEAQPVNNSRPIPGPALPWASPLLTKGESPACVEKSLSRKIMDQMLFRFHVQRKPVWFYPVAVFAVLISPYGVCFSALSLSVCHISAISCNFSQGLCFHPGFAPQLKAAHSVIPQWDLQGFGDISHLLNFRALSGCPQRRQKLLLISTASSESGHVPASVTLQANPSAPFEKLCLHRLGMI